MCQANVLQVILFKELLADYLEDSLIIVDLDLPVPAKSVMFETCLVDKTLE